MGRRGFDALARRAVDRLLGRSPPTPRDTYNPQQYYPGHSFGRYTYGLPQIFWEKPGRTFSIGNYCSIGPGVVIMLGGNHILGAVSTFPFAELTPGGAGLPLQEVSKGNVAVGHDVWLGKECLIMSGVTIGSGAVIGARSVVTRDVAPYSVVAGNPSRHIRYRVPEQWIPALLEIAWWDWPDGRVLAARPELLSGDVESFVRRYGSEKHSDERPAKPRSN